MARKKNNKLKLEILAESCDAFSVSSNYEGILKMKTGDVKTVITPDETLYMEQATPLSIAEITPRQWDELIMSMSRKTGLLKYILGESSQQVKLTGELPFKDEKSLRTAFRLLSASFENAHRTALVSRSGSIPGLPESAGAYRQQTERALQTLVNHKVEAINGHWRVKIQDGLQPHCIIDIHADLESRSMLFCSAIGKRGPGDQASLNALVLFMMDAMRRLRLVAAALTREQDDQVVITLCCQVPYDLLEFFTPARAVNNVAAAAIFCKAPIEALLNQDVYQAYLKMACAPN